MVAQLVPFYTDWLWFDEVGYRDVFLSILYTRGVLFTGMLAAVLVFLWINLSFAARTAAPDVVWELEDQLGLPGRVVIEPLLIDEDYYARVVRGILIVWDAERACC
jgi:uncharacterized membrane protein (UPF0182 family)